MSNKLDIKNEMKAIDCRDYEYYNSLSDEERAEYDKQIWIQMRWCSSVRGPLSAHYLILTNLYANVNFTEIRKHPQLQHRLLQCVGLGTSQYHEWIKPGKKATQNRLAAWVSSLYPHMKDDEIELFLEINTKEDLRDLAESLNLSKKEIKDIFK